MSIRLAILKPTTRNRRMALIFVWAAGVCLGLSFDLFTLAVAAGIFTPAVLVAAARMESASLFASVAKLWGGCSWLRLRLDDARHRGAHGLADSERGCASALRRSGHAGRRAEDATPRRSTLTGVTRWPLLASLFQRPEPFRSRRPSTGLRGPAFPSRPSGAPRVAPGCKVGLENTKTQRKVPAIRAQQRRHAIQP